MTHHHSQSRIQTPIAKARGLGAAKTGTHHWIMQRITAVTNLVLLLWLTWSVLCLPLENYYAVRDWLTHPINAILLVLTVISLFKHTILGLEVVLEDYIHCHPARVVKILLMKFTYIILGAACIFSILKVAI